MIRLVALSIILTACGTNEKKPSAALTSPPTTSESQGATGEQGPAGPQGAAGKDGIDGKDGTNGIDGKDGANGKDGAPGKDGTNGIDGATGAAGAAGHDAEYIWTDPVNGRIWLVQGLFGAALYNEACGLPFVDAGLADVQQARADGLTLDDGITTAWYINAQHVKSVFDFADGSVSTEGINIEWALCVHN